MLLVIWHFKSWVICADTVPPTILGHYEWSVQLEITVGKGESDTTATVTHTGPEWTDAPDKNDYNHVVDQTPGGGGADYKVP